jgi:hypothetical protein
VTLELALVITVSSKQLEVGANDANADLTNETFRP